MLKGLPAVAHLESIIPRLTCLCLLAQLCLGARVPGANREESDLVNPLGAGEEERRLLQSYIQANLKEGEGSDVSTWEQAVFFLFHLYDFDRSGHIDGLEMMKLLLDYNSHAPLEATSNEPIVTMVDFLLKTRDLNQDGLLGPSELLSSPLPYTQDSVDEALQKGEMAVEEKLVAPEDSLKTGGEELAQEELQTGGEHEDNIHQEKEVRHKEEVPLDQVLEDNEREQKELDEQIPQAPAPVEQGKGQQQQVLVHHGQPEM